MVKISNTVAVRIQFCRYPLIFAAILVCVVSEGAFIAWATESELTIDPAIESSPQLQQLSGFSVGIGVAVPEIMTIESHYRASERWQFRLSFAPPIYAALKAEVGTQRMQVESRLQASTLNETSKISLWNGMYVGFDTTYSLPGSSFNVLGGMMYRELRGEAELKTPMRVCFVTVDEECSEDSAFYTTTSSMRAVANYHSYSIGMTAGLGWTYRLGEKLEIALVPIGLYIPLHTVRKVDSKLFPVSDQVGGDGLQQEVNNSVGKASAKAESLMREQVDEKADLIERLPVPWARISIAYQLH